MAHVLQQIVEEKHRELARRKALRPRRELERECQAAAPARDRVRFSIDPAGPGHGAAAVLVFSVTGRRVARIPANGGSLEWNGRDLSGRKVPSGLYFARLEGDRNAPGSKFMLIH